MDNRCAKPQGATVGRWSAREGRYGKARPTGTVAGICEKSALKGDDRPEGGRRQGLPCYLVTAR